MGEVVRMYPCTDVPATLRLLADRMDAGELPADTCSLVIGSDVFCLGPALAHEAAAQAVFDFTFGIHKLMKAATDD